MAESRVDPTLLAGIVDWLEDDHRQLRDQVAHLEQEVGRLAAGQRDQILQQRTAVTDLDGMRQQGLRIAPLEVSIRQVQEDIGDIRALLVQQSSALERAERGLSLELERLRIQIAELGQRQTVLSEELQPLPVRIQALNDHNRRLQDQLTALQVQADTLTGQQATLQTKIDLSVEQVHRLDQAVAGVSQEFAPLRREDEVLASRVQLAMDLARNVETMIAEVLAEEQSRRELAERIDILHAERQRIQAQLADLDHLGSVLQERTEELHRVLRIEGGRRLVLAERVTEIESRLLETRQSGQESVIQIWQAVEEQKRRDIAHLQEQAKFLRDALQRLTRPVLPES